MTTKTMDGEEYLANLESADEQNYKRLFGEEYIKKSDVEQYLITWRNLDIIRGLQDLPTINLSVIDEMIEEVRKVEANPTDPKFPFYTQRLTLQELKQRLSPNK